MAKTQHKPSSMASSTVHIALLLSGIIEIVFALTVFFFPENGVVKSAIHDCIGSKTAPVYWAIGVMGIGISCLFAYYLSKSLQHHRTLSPYHLLVAAPTLLSVIIYNVGILVVMYLTKRSFDTLVATDPTLLLEKHPIIVPILGHVTTIDPHSFASHGMATHIAILSLTLLAMVQSLRF